MPADRTVPAKPSRMRAKYSLQSELKCLGRPSISARLIVTPISSITPRAMAPDAGGFFILVLIMKPPGQSATVSQFDIFRFTVDKPENDLPVPLDPYTPAHLKRTRQGMKGIARNVHVLHLTGNTESSQNCCGYAEHATDSGPVHRPPCKTSAVTGYGTSWPVTVRNAYHTFNTVAEIPELEKPSYCRIILFSSFSSHSGSC